MAVNALKRIFTRRTPALFQRMCLTSRLLPNNLAWNAFTRSRDGRRSRQKKSSGTTRCGGLHQVLNLKRTPGRELVTNYHLSPGACQPTRPCVGLVSRTDAELSRVALLRPRRLGPTSTHK